MRDQRPARRSRALARDHRDNAEPGRRASPNPSREKRIARREKCDHDPLRREGSVGDSLWTARRGLLGLCRALPTTEPRHFDGEALFFLINKHQRRPRAAGGATPGSGRARLQRLSDTVLNRMRRCHGCTLETRPCGAACRRPARRRGREPGRGRGRERPRGPGRASTVISAGRPRRAPGATHGSRRAWIRSFSENGSYLEPRRRTEATGPRCEQRAPPAVCSHGALVTASPGR
jgi:hypothetical protein